MSWKPMSGAELSARVAEEAAHLSEQIAQRWEQCRVDPFQQAYLTRTAKAGEEPVYVVARTDRGVVFFDDVEDEFGLAQIDERGRLSRAVLCGELRWALTSTPADRWPSAYAEPIEEEDEFVSDQGEQRTPRAADGMSDLAAKVTKFGWAVVRVEASGQEPSLAYSVGLIQSFGHPEVIIFGLALDTLQQMVNNIGNEVKRGVRFGPGTTSAAILEGYDCAFRPVALGATHAYMGLASQYYGREIEALNCVWPDKQGRFPWEVGATPEFRRLQPMLVDGPESFTRERP